MNKRKSDKFHERLVSVYELIQRGEAKLALSELYDLKQKLPSNADVAHLIALAYKADNNYERSVEYFNLALDINIKQPQVHNNLANLYLANQLYDKAEKHYAAAISMQPKYYDAMRNLALCHAGQGNYSLAVEEYSSLLESHPDDVSAATGLANCFREMSDLPKARQMYEQALTIAPNHLNAWHNLGLNYHLMGQLDEALKCYAKAYDLAPNTVEVVQSFASTLHEAGFADQAIDIFEQALNTNPGSALLHQRLNELLWQEGRIEQFCSSYGRAVERDQDSLEIRLSYVKQLFRSAQTNRAAVEVVSALKVFQGDHQLLSLKGQIEAEDGDYLNACESLSESLSKQFTKDAAYTLVKINVIQSHYDRAQRTINELFNKHPDCQLSWALQSLVWRLTNDERYVWLNQYDQFVRVYEIEVPEGYANLEQYLNALEQALLGLHRTEQAPLEQTLRHGTQTAARLFSQPVPEIIALKKSLDKIVQSYIDEMPDDLNHPLLSRKKAGFEFSGSWSVKLKPRGFHVNHVHPEGWISSSVYISIPNSITTDQTGLQGAIKFGESPLNLGSREIVEKTISPQPGTVVLFPSYMWHGTHPYDGAETDFRMTAPFDVIPNN